MSLEVVQLGKTYGSQKALDDVSFRVDLGEIVGLLGPNGAGKSTCMRIITGYITDFTGQASVQGFDVRSESSQARQRIGYLPEHNPLYTEMYVREYLRFVASIFRLKAASSRIDHLIQLTGLRQEAHKRISSLSKGYRQRVGLAQALLQDPQVLILDEPTSGLDPNQLIEIRELIRSLGTEKTILFSSHILQEVEALCDRVVILDQGKLVANQILSEEQREGQIIEVLFDQPVPEEVPNLAGLVKTELLTDNRCTFVFSGSGDARGDVFDYAVRRGLRILEMQGKQRSVADLFAGLTQKKM